MLFPRSKSLTPSDAAAALARGELQLIGVPEPSEVSEARVKGSRHIPLGQLAAKLSQLYRDRPVAFLCRPEVAPPAPPAQRPRPGSTPQTPKAA